MVNSPFPGGSGGGGTGSTDTDDETTDDTESEDTTEPDTSSQRRRATPGGGHTAGPTPGSDTPDGESTEPSTDSSSEDDVTSAPAGSPDTPARGGDTGDPSSGGNFTDDSGGDTDSSGDSSPPDSASDNGGGGERDSELNYDDRVPTEEEMTTRPGAPTTEAAAGESSGQPSRVRGTPARGGNTGAPSSGAIFADDVPEEDRSDDTTQDYDAGELEFDADTVDRSPDEPGTSIADIGLATRLDDMLADEYGSDVDAEYTAIGDDAVARVDTDQGTRFVPITLSDDAGQAEAAAQDLQADYAREQLADQRSQYEAVRAGLLNQSLEADLAEASQVTDRQQDTAEADLTRGNLGDSRDILREDIAAQVDEDVTSDDVSVQRSGGELTGAVTGAPREEVVAGLEEQTGLELSTEDVDFEQTTNQDDQEVISGELDSDAMRRYRQEQAPGQGTPLEGLFEAGAGLQYDYEQSDVTAGVEDAYNEVTPDVSGVEDTFNEYTPDTSGVEDTFNRYTPDTPSSDDLLGAAAAGAPLAAAEPTPAGEIIVGGVALAGGLALAGESLSQRTASSGAASATTTEVDVPEEQFADELSVDGAASQFPNELGTPAGVTPRVNRGELSPGALFVESELDATADTSVDEIRVGEDEDSGTDIVNRDDRSYVGDEYPTTEASEAPASPGGNVPTGGETPTGPSGPQGPTLPADQPGQVGDGGAFGGIAGRDLPQRRGFQDAEQSFFGVDLVNTFDPVDPLTSEDQASIGGSQPGMFSGVEAGILGSATAATESPVDVDANARGEGAANSLADAPSTATSTVQSTPATTANVNAPGVTANAPRFDNPGVQANAFSEQYDFSGLGYGMGFEYTTTRSPRRPPNLPEPEPEADPRRDDPMPGFSDVFENPTIEAGDAVNFDAVGDDLDSLF